MDLSNLFEEAIENLQQVQENERYERLRLDFTKVLLANNDLLHERSFEEICKLGIELTNEYIRHGKL